jgi:hypothetical protein
MGLAGLFASVLESKGLIGKVFQEMEANLRTDAIAAFSGRARGQQTCD